MATNTTLEVIDPSFKDLVFPHVALEKISTGHIWTEGPVWFGELETLVFSDIPNTRICRWNAEVGSSVMRAQSNYANGNTRDLQGRLLTCEHGTRRLTRTERNGEITVLADSFEGKRLNSPNDVIVKSDGSIWFSDPSYGIKNNFEGFKADAELSGRFVFRIDPDTQELEKVIEGFSQPNGLAFSKSEDKLYVADSGKSHDDSVASVIRVFDVGAKDKLSPPRDFVTIDRGVPDGMRVDIYDNVWTSAEDGVHCYSSNGTLLGKIKVPETVSNLTFGGPRGNQLFITASTSVYSTFVNSSSAIIDR